MVTKLDDTEQLPPEDKEPPTVTKLESQLLDMEDENCERGRGRLQGVCYSPWTICARMVHWGLLNGGYSCVSSCTSSLVNLVRYMDKCMGVSLSVNVNVLVFCVSYCMSMSV